MIIRLADGKWYPLIGDYRNIARERRLWRERLAERDVPTCSLHAWALGAKPREEPSDG